MTTETQTAGTGTHEAGTPATNAGADTLLGGTPAAAPAAQAPADASPTAFAQATADGKSVEPATPAATEGNPAEQAADGKSAAAAQGAPEQYADFVAPEGIAFNPEAMDAFKALAKEKNLSQEDAQKFADLGAKSVQQAQAKQMEQIEQVQAQWHEAARIDKEFGGDRLDANMAIAGKALAAFGSPELKQLLTESKLGNHPEVIRAFYRVGLAISEDKLVPGSTKPSGQRPEQKMYSASGMNP